tara:strand:+ start:12830 stop:13042 length:213 start_codon:yes stop_codon:yes gene_type:complete
MPPKEVPVFDYRDGKKGGEVNPKNVHGVNKVVAKNLGGGKINTPYQGDGKGLHGGVMQKDRKGDNRVVYH